MYPIFRDKMYEAIPTWEIWVLHLAFNFFLCDLGDYWNHRMFHSPWLYKTFHKQHHEFKSTIGLTAVYASPLCDLFVNSLPTMVGSLIWRPHPLIFLVFVAIRIEEAVEGLLREKKYKTKNTVINTNLNIQTIEHCGFEIPFSIWSLFRDNGHHDFHHSHNIGCYGTFGFWDFICGTDKHYRQYQLKQGIQPSTRLHLFSWSLLALLVAYCAFIVFLRR